MADEPRTDEMWEKLEGLVVAWHSAAGDERRALADKLTESRERFDALLGDIQARQEHDAERAKAAMGAVKELRKALSDADRLRAAVGEAEALATQRGQELERLRDDLLKTQKALAERTDAAQAAQQRIEELTESEGRLVEAQRVAEAKSSELERALIEARRSAGDSHERIAALESRLAAFGEAGKQAEQRLETVQEELRIAQTSLHDRDTLVSRLEETLKERTEALEALREQAATLQQMAATETLRVRDAERHASTAEGALSTAKEESDSLRSELEAAQRHQAEAREQLAKLGDEIRHATSDRDAARDELDRVRRQLNTAQEAVEETRETKRLLEVERERAELLNERLRQETARGTKSALAEQLAQALKDNEEARQEILALRRELRRTSPNGKNEGAAAAAPAEIPEPEKLSSPEDTVDGVAELDEFIDFDDVPRTPLGESLLQSGMVTREQLGRALDEQRRSPGRRLESILVEKGFAREDDVASALAGLCGSRVVHLRDGDVRSDVAHLITGRLALLHMCIPVRATDDQLTLAMANPMDLIAIEDVERASQRRVEPVAAPASEIRAAIQQAY